MRDAVGVIPRITFVVAVRDPSYGGGLLYRTQVFVNGLLELAKRFTLSCEVVVVEWNPVSGTGRFRETLLWKEPLAPVAFRFIEVPSEIHRRLPNSERMDFHITVARNVGIRRARGEYILGTSPDVLFNPSLIRFLAHGSLSTEAFYRIDRRDLSHDLPMEWSVDQQLAYCEAQDVTVHTYYGSIRETGHSSPPARLRTWLRHQSMIREYRRYRSDPSYQGSPDKFGGDRLIIPADGLHRNASGEFFLMHRDRWHELRGYTELPTFGHGDSILCWTAASAGLRQVILKFPHRLYHQPHDRELQARWPFTDWRPWYERYLECRRAGRILIANNDGWGLEGEAFPEWSFGG